MAAIGTPYIQTGWIITLWRFRLATELPHKTDLSVWHEWQNHYTWWSIRCDCHGRCWSSCTICCLNYSSQRWCERTSLLRWWNPRSGKPTYLQQESLLTQHTSDPHGFRKILTTIRSMPSYQTKLQYSVENFPRIRSSQSSCWSANHGIWAGSFRAYGHKLIPLER